uniref:Short-chain dehydrogenase n=1 Tax=Colletotrichum fructicola (strain Nara gc5) TaxID=1213859 RepID=L2G849_COLFN
MSAKRVALITGANTGIGYETIKALPSSDRSYHILLGSRSMEKGAAAAAQPLHGEHPRNALILTWPGCALTEPDTPPREALNVMYNTNVSGQHVVTMTFAPLLIKSDDPRLLFLTSGTAHLARFAEEFWPGEAPAAGWPKPASQFAPPGQDGAEHAPLGVALDVEGGRGEGLGDFAGAVGDEPGRGPGVVEEAGSGGSESWRVSC